MSNYTIQKIGIDNEPLSYINVTSITGLLDKPNLKQWAADLAVNYIMNNSFIKLSNEGTDNTIYTLDQEILNEAKIAHKQRLNETADIGSELHRLVESFINLKINNAEDKNLDIKEINFLFAIKDYYLKQMFMQFYLWQIKNVKRFLESEKPVCEQDLCYGGTLDFIYIGYDNKTYLCDLKTSNGIYKDMELQAVSYKQARESMEGDYKVFCECNNESWTKTLHYDKIKIDEVSILNISRDYFSLEHKIVKDVEYLQQAFNYLLGFYYVFAKRRVNNIRARERR